MKNDWLEDRDAIVDVGYESDNRFKHGVFQADREDLDSIRPDNVNNPPHYTQGSIECIDAIRAALGEDGFKAFCRGNSIKYLWRYNRKGGSEDLKKATWYIDRLLSEIDKDEAGE